MNVSEILYKAADLIEERGWTRGFGGWPQATRDGAPLCLEGGIMAALGMTLDPRANGGDSSTSLSDVETSPAYVAVAAHLDFTGALCWWNDELDRTAEEVVEVLRAAAVIEAANEESAAARELVAVR